MREQIHAATAQAVTESGYEAASVEQICAIADLERGRFHDQFASKLEAVISAVESVADHVMADCQLAFSGAEDWPQAVWRATIAFTDWAACEPSLARLGIVELAHAGPEGEELLRSLIDAFALFLAPGYPLLAERAEPTGERAPAIGSLDAAVGARILQMLREHIASGSPQTLPSIAPDLARAALSPFLGAEAAERAIAECLAAERG